ncbi:hypothetical protein DFH08DRAFT_37667 [Mycena albidolilacea]|uniref:Uncharacterized protein n=1 Tax=Mycena albidolilacea TaxID=1033008 RepID=A0AAD7AWI3_9AGAR|nr:hypothetical protein DFH08DRAFT_37667 [Mycena albidolilacea]
MQLTFVTDLGQSYSMDIDSGMELENVMALLEAEVRCSFLTFFLCSSRTAVGNPCRRTKRFVQRTGH